MSKKTRKILNSTILFLILISTIIPFVIDAQSGTGSGSSSSGSGTTVAEPIKMQFEIPNPFKQKSIESFIKAVVNEILMPIGAVVAGLMVMYAGFLYVTARGSETQIKKAHDALLYAVIGAAILLGAWVISNAINATINELKV